MKYTMVKQFSNGALDNVYNFFYKIVDFGKIMIEVFWAFVEIWQAFFLIFANIGMYFYYLFLFIIDFSADESKGTLMSFKKGKTGVSRTPSISISGSGSPRPSVYTKAKDTTKSAVSAAASTADSIRPGAKGTGAKGSIIKSTLEFFSNFFSSIASFFTAPFKALAGFFGPKMKPVREEPVQASSTRLSGSGSGSLIDEYMKEYEQKRK